MQAIMSFDNADQKLVARAQAGEREARETLAARLHDPLDRYVRLRVGPHLRQKVEIEDVLQEAFTKAFTSIAQFRGRSEQQFLKWLQAIAERVILKLARYHRRDQVLFVEQKGAPFRDVTPSRAMQRDERFERLQQALESLSPDHREVITLARLQGLRTEEIARRMNRSTNAVLNVLFRALSKLREAFGDTESFSLPPRRLDQGESHDGT